MAKLNRRVALYYFGDAKPAKLRAEELRADGAGVSVLDAAVFADTEQVSNYEFVGTVPEEHRRRISASYAAGGIQEGIKENSKMSIKVPEDWESLSYEEKQSLAALMTDEPVRSPEDADRVIKTYIRDFRGGDPHGHEVPSEDNLMHGNTADHSMGDYAAQQGPGEPTRPPADGNEDTDYAKKAKARVPAEAARHSENTADKPIEANMAAKGKTKAERAKERRQRDK